MRRRLLWFGLVGLLVDGCATRPVTPPVLPEPYMRVIEPEAGVVQLEIAARRFTPRRGTGPTIWLTGASHLGETAYYRALQHHLDECTLVLFEGVGGAEARRGPELRRDTAEGSSLQARLARSLGLAFQLEAVDYDRAHFRNSDLTVAELRDLMSGTGQAAAAAGETNSARTEAAQSFEQLLQVMQGESFLGRLMNLGLRWLGTQPRYQALAKFTLMEMLNNVQGDLESVGALPPAMQELLRVLIDERNQRVLVDLRRELPRLSRADSLAVFYGAGHMRDLEIRLRRELRYEPRDEIWFAAMTVNVTAAGITSVELGATRELIQRQIETLRVRSPRVR